MLINKITPEILKKMYHDDKKSLADISREFGCTRQYVYKLMRYFNIDRRDNLQARLLSLKYKINEDFFSQWSPEMSYVLGLIFTDGCIQKDKRGRSVSVVLSINDLSLLEKVRNLMGSTHRITKLKQKGLYRFGFGREKILKDLTNLGLTPNKSRVIKFPDVPDEYMRHFIRGCWDGDGSVFCQYYNRNLLMSSYVSGSREYIEKMEQILHEKAGLTKRKIYQRPSGTSYYFKYAHKDSIKLFHYMYDGVPNSMFLERKYDHFQKALPYIPRSKRYSHSEDAPEVLKTFFRLHYKNPREFSIRGLARYIGCSARTVYRWARAEYQLNSKCVRKIGEYLNEKGFIRARE